MGKESPTWTVVEDEHGKGHFTMVTETGGVEESLRVPAIADLYGRPELEYVKEQFDKGKSVIVYRYGSEGMCAVQVNPALLKVTEIIRYFPDSIQINKINSIRVFPMDHYNRQIIQCISPGIEIKGKSASGESVKVTVSFNH